MKTLETCSWLYWGKYHLNLPDKTNDGAIRGSICHLIFELLLTDKHKHHYDKIVDKNDLEASQNILQKFKAKQQNDDSSLKVIESGLKDSKKRLSVIQKEYGDQVYISNQIKIVKEKLHSSEKLFIGLKVV